MDSNTHTTDTSPPAGAADLMANGMAPGSTETSGVTSTTAAAAGAAAAAAAESSSPAGSAEWKRKFTDLDARRRAQFSSQPAKRLKKIKEDEEIVRTAAFEVEAVEFLGDVTSALVRFEQMDGETAG